MASDDKPEIGVLYLARAADGTASFKRFVDSYSACPGGVDHDLWIALKGFPSERAIADYIGSAPAVAFKRIDVPNHGFDIGSYWHAARRLDGRYQYLCFLNTHSELLDRNWLQYMYRRASLEEVGAVGASGSYESLYPVEIGQTGNANVSICGTLGAIKRRITLWQQRMSYPPFPNPHLRTNAIMLQWQTMRRVWPRLVYNKQAALRFESGAHSLTNRILRTGLKVLVVGRDGQSYDIACWPHSATFRLGGQKNLLVADNRTRDFEAANVQERLRLARMAWGDWISADNVCGIEVDHVGVDRPQVT